MHKRSRVYIGAAEVCNIRNTHSILLTLGAHAQKGYGSHSVSVCLFVCPILNSRTPTLVAKNKVLAYNTRYYLPNEGVAFDKNLWFLRCGDIRAPLALHANVFVTTPTPRALFRIYMNFHVVGFCAVEGCKLYPLLSCPVL